MIYIKDPVVETPTASNNEALLDSLKSTLNYRLHQRATTLITPAVLFAEYPRW